MTHHWQPSDGLIAGPRPGGEWLLYDRSTFVGTIGDRASEQATGIPSSHAEQGSRRLRLDA